MLRGAGTAIAAATLLLTTRIGHAEWLRQDVVVYADPALKSLLARLGTLFGQVDVFTAPPTQMLALLAHGTQDDVLLTQSATMNEAAHAGLAGRERRPIWRNHLVFAAAGNPAPSQPYSEKALLALLAGGTLAVPDATPASSVDGASVLGKLGLAVSLAGRTIGAANTGDVAFLLRTGAAGAGLCHRSEVSADDTLHEAMPVPAEAYEPILYEAALARGAWSRRQDDFLSFLAGADAVTIARKAGLEMA